MPGEREAATLRYLAEHTATAPGLVKHVIHDRTITYDVFAATAAAAFVDAGYATGVIA